MTTFNVLAIVDVLSEANIHMVVESYTQFYHNQMSKHQAKIHLYLFSNNPFSYQHENVSVDKMGFNIHVVCSRDREVTSRVFKEATILFLPVMNPPNATLEELLICGVPVLCHQKSEIKKHLKKQYALFAGHSDPNILYHQNHAVDDYSDMLEMLFFDPTVQKLLKKKADKKYRRKINADGNRVEVLQLA